MSPQVCSNSYYNTKTDIWSLGITCIELMEGDPPYNNIKPSLVMNLIVKEPPTGEKLFCKERLEEFKYSDEFINFVTLCLEVDPQKRPSAEELLKSNFIKKFSKGRDIIKNLVLKHLDDIENYRKEEEEEMKIENENKNKNQKVNNYKGKGNFNKRDFSNLNEDYEKSEDIKIENVNDEYVLKLGKKNNESEFENNNFDFNKNDDDYSESNSVLIKNTNKSNLNYSDNCSVINKNSVNTFISNKNGNDIKKNNNNSPEFMKYVMNNQFIFNEDDYIAIETKNIVDNLNNDEKSNNEENKNDFDEITKKINELEIKKEKRNK